MLTIKDLDNLQNTETPFYYYDMALLRKTLEIVKTESQRYGFKVHYAIKANFDSAILEEILKAGLGIDCVSGNEVMCAIDAGFSPKDIVYAGVAKSDKEINYCLDNNISTFNCESKEELEIINSLAAKKGKTATIALRINPDIEPSTHKHIATGHADSKFGISYGEVDDVFDLIGTLNNIKIAGLHFHIGSQIVDLTAFEKLCERVNTISTWFKNRGLHLEHINVGGGLGINYQNPESEPIANFEKYFAIFARNLKLESYQTLHFELGRSIVGQCGELVSRVLFNKVTASGKKYIFIDAGMTNLIRPALYGAKHRIINLSSTEKEEIYSVAGPICESSDIFANDISLPRTHRGDIIVIQSVGAYGRSMASNYNLKEIAPSVYDK